MWTTGACGPETHAHLAEITSLDLSRSRPRRNGRRGIALLATATASVAIAAVTAAGADRSPL
jgi:hypothetical protein